MGKRTIKPEQLVSTINAITKEMVEHIGVEVENRSLFRVANEIKNAELETMRGGRSGRVYRGHQASAPGEAPAWRTGGLAQSFNPIMSPKISRSGSNRTIQAGVESSYASGKWLIGDLMEDGTRRIARRPYKDRTIEKALPNIMKIYKEPYLRG